MGNLLSCFNIGCNCTLNIDKEVRYILCPGREAQSLRSELATLQSTKLAVENQMRELEGQPGVAVRSDVTDWVVRVGSLHEEVAELMSSLARYPPSSRLLCCCLYPSNYTLAEQITDMVDRVRNLMAQYRDWGGNFAMSIQPPFTSKEMLQKELKNLVDVRKDLESEVEQLLLDPRKAQSSVLNTWSTEADLVVREVEEFIVQLPQQGIEEAQRSNEEIQQKIARMRLQIKTLCDERRERLGSGNLVIVAPPERVNQLPGSMPTSLVGVEESISEVIGYLKDDEVGVVGIYGMGGVGKTAIVREIVRRLSFPGDVDFDQVISVVVSRNPSVFRIQEDVGVRLGYSRSDENRENRAGRPLPPNEGDRAHSLSRLLARKKFLLVLDDVWDRLDLGLIGVPSLNDGTKSKIVLTTRDLNVCVDMECQRNLKVGFLGQDNSRLLFRNKIQNDKLLESQEIRLIAEDILQKCGGLPLVIITIARAMANKRSLSEWQDAEVALDDFPSLIRGMERDVLQWLKFSFDNLERDEYRSCLLYCALFPEDESISISRLIKYWIVEGLLEFCGSCNIDTLRGRGCSIITTLQEACLLERGEDDEHLKMHDAIHDMAIWLGQGGGCYEHKFLTKAGKALEQAVIDDTWHDLERVSLMESGITKIIACGVVCQSLHTLLINDTPLADLPENIFYFTPNLHLLDLSSSYLGGIPKSLYSLRSLQYLDLSSTQLEHISESIGSLVSLQLLDLSRNKIMELPMQVGRLTNLVELNLANNEISSIPFSFIPSLSKLQVLRLSGNYCFGKEGKGQLIIKDLHDSFQLNNVTITIGGDSSNVHALFESCILLRSITKLEIYDVHDLITVNVCQTNSRLSKLKEFTIINCLQMKSELVLSDDSFPVLETLYLSGVPLTSITLTSQLGRLGYLCLFRCHKLEDISCLAQLPGLRAIDMYECDGIVMLLSYQACGHDDQGHNMSFPKLESIHLQEMPSLMGISCCCLCMPSLTEMTVVECPNLKKLSIIPSKVVSINCKMNWWNELEWDEAYPQSLFKTCFFEIW